MPYAVTVALLPILALVVFIFGGGEFPDSVGWVGIILAVGGLVMAAPSIFQMLWGGPLLKTEFERYAQGTERMLGIHLKNPPVSRRLLKILGVRREPIAGLEIEMRLIKNNIVLIPARGVGIISGEFPDDKLRSRVSLPPTFSSAAYAVIAGWDEQRNRAVIPANRYRDAVVLEPGYYMAVMLFSKDGVAEKMSRRFVVGDKADDLVWANA